MEPIRFRDANTTYVGEGVGDLPAFVGWGMIVTCWRASWWERVKVLFSGRVWCAMLGDVCPALCLQGGGRLEVEHVHLVDEGEAG